MASDLFTTVLTPAILTGDQELILALGRTTLVNLTSTGPVTIYGIFSTTGFADGMVVVLSNLNNNTSQLTAAHESGLANPNDRFRNAGLTGVSGGTGAGCLWFRYNSAISGGRFIMIGKTS